MPLPMKLLIPVCAGLALALTCGCTPTYLITEPIDAQMIHTVGPQAFSRQFPPGVTFVQVFTESLSTKGDSIWFTGVDSSLYEARWGAWVERSGLQLRPGDSVEVEVSGLFRDPLAGRFRGISEGDIYLGDAGEGKALYTKGIRFLRSGEREWTGEDIWDVIQRTHPPAMLNVNIRTESGDTVSVPLDAVRYGEYRRRFNWEGLWGALLVDAAFLSIGALILLVSQ